MQLFIFIVIFIVILHVMNVFANLFGHIDKFSVKERKSNLRGYRFTEASRSSSFHFISFGFCLERRKEDRWLLPEVCSFWWATSSVFSG
jgi:hypothetical protein